VHRRDIPGKMIIRSWKNFGAPERGRETEKREGRAGVRRLAGRRGEEREREIVAETKQQFLAMSLSRAHLSRGLFSAGNCFSNDASVT